MDHDPDAPHDPTARPRDEEAARPGPPSDPAPRRAAGRGERTRARILAAAVELLGRDGPAGFSAATLAREAGVAKATLFHHFDAIDDVPLAALEELLIESVTREVRADLGLRDFLEELGRETRAMARERRDFLNAWFVFSTKALFDERVRDRLARGAGEMHAHLRAAVASRLPPGRPPEEIEALARLLGMALDGLGLHLLMLDDDEGYERAWRLLVDLVLARLEPGTAS